MKKIGMVIGQKINMLTLLRKTDEKRHTYFMYEFQCDCGNITKTRPCSVVNGVTRSCGCLRGEVGHEFPVRKTKLHQTWRDMKQRCLNPNNRAYKYYGARGITVSEEWQKSFKQFAKDMGERPEGMWLERIDNNLGYCKENCTWETPSNQLKNRRSWKHGA